MGWTRTQLSWFQSQASSQACPELYQTHPLLLRDSPRSMSLICPQGHDWALLTLLPITYMALL